MRIDDLTAEERAEFRAELAEVETATEALGRAAAMLDARGYTERAHRLRGNAQAIDAQVYLLMQDWEQTREAASKALAS